MEQNTIKLVNRLCLAIVLISLFGGLFISPFFETQTLIMLLTEGIVLLPILFSMFVKGSRPSRSELIFTGIGLILGIFLPIYLERNQMLMLINQTLLLLPAVLFLIYKGESLRSYIRVKKMSISTFLLVVVLTYTMFPMIAFLNMVSMLFATNIIEATVSNVVGNSVIKGLFLIALVPAFVEETVYRGVIYHTFKKANPRRAIFFSALLFGAAHMNFNQFVYAFALGVLMATLIEITDSILAAMTMHFLFNGTSILASTLINTGSESVSNMSNHEILKSLVELAPSALVFFGVGILLIRLIAKNNGRLDYLNRIVTGKESGSGARIVTPGLIVALILCLLAAIALEMI